MVVLVNFKSEQVTTARKKRDKNERNFMRKHGL